ncbi:MAG: hypothetical protein HY247_00060 [archaeon]|nr:MAG: hypothetical protein HY247_00060 [archaeon]
MIEIGKERTLAHGARRTANAFYAIGAVLVLVWLLRGYLAVSQYSETLLAASFGAGFFASAFRTNTSRGAARAVSTLLGNMGFQCILIIILIWFFGWIAILQGDNAYPAVFGMEIPNLAIAAIFLWLVSIIVGQGSSRTRELQATGPALLLKSTSSTTMGEIKLTVKADSIGLPVRKSKRTVGCVVSGDLNAVFETPMGSVTATIAGPVTSFGVPFRGMKATGEQVEKLTGKKLRDLIKETEVENSIVGETEFEVDLPPFVHVKMDPYQDSVDIGPLSVRSGPNGETVKIGPILINADEASEKWFGRRQWGKHGRFSSWWSVKGIRDSSYISSSGGGIKAKWNGSSLDLKQDTMKLKVGSDGFSYSPQELETNTPLHTLRVTQSKVTLNTKRFTLDVVGTRVVLRTEDGSKSTDSAELARDLRTLLAEMAKKQVSDVLEGLPIELDEMMSGTEELLKKYA